MALSLIADNVEKSSQCEKDKMPDAISRVARSRLPTKIGVGTWHAGKVQKILIRKTVTQWLATRQAAALAA